MAYDMKVVGAAIKRLRSSAEMSQQDLADTIGVAQSTIGRMEVGRDVGFTLANLSAVADFFGVKVGALIDGDADLVAAVQVRIAKAVVCRDCGVIGSGLSTEEARKLRVEHTGAHVRGER